MRRARRGDESGAVIVLVAACMVMALAFLALVVDLGNARQLRRQAQASADASALAGAQELLAVPLSWPNVVAVVKAYAFNNSGVPSEAWSACRDGAALAYTPDPPGTCISSDSAANPTRLRVRLPSQTATSFFGPILGHAAVSVSAGATAAATPATGASPVDDAAVSCVVCVLSPTASPALENKGKGTLAVTGSGVLVNSVIVPAASLKGQGGLTAPFISGPAALIGFETKGQGQYSPQPTVRLAVPDPLIGQVACPAAGTTAPCPTGASQGDVTTGRTLNPGVYGNIALTSGTLTLNPGTYVVTKGMTLTSGVTLRATEVTLYFGCASYPTACSVGQVGAGLTLSGSGLTLVAPTTGPFTGIAVMFDRNNTAPAALSDVTLTGATYMKAARLTFTGSLNTTLNGLIAVATTTVDTQGDVNVTYIRSSSGGTVGLSG